MSATVGVPFDALAEELDALVEVEQLVLDLLVDQQTPKLTSTLVLVHTTIGSLRELMRDGEKERSGSDG
jgi:hypothetical protein